MKIVTSILGDNWILMEDSVQKNGSKNPSIPLDEDGLVERLVHSSQRNGSCSNFLDEISDGDVRNIHKDGNKGFFEYKDHRNPGWYSKGKIHLFDDPNGFATVVQKRDSYDPVVLIHPENTDVEIHGSGTDPKSQQTLRYFVYDYGLKRDGYNPFCSAHPDIDVAKKQADEFARERLSNPLPEFVDNEMVLESELGYDMFVRSKQSISKEGYIDTYTVEFSEPDGRVDPVEIIDVGARLEDVLRLRDDPEYLMSITNLNDYRRDASSGAHLKDHSLYIDANKGTISKEYDSFSERYDLVDSSENDEFSFSLYEAVTNKSDIGRTSSPSAIFQAISYSTGEEKSVILDNSYDIKDIGFIAKNTAPGVSLDDFDSIREWSRFGENPQAIKNIKKAFLEKSLINVDSAIDFKQALSELGPHEVAVYTPEGGANERVIAHYHQSSTFQVPRDAYGVSMRSHQMIQRLDDYPDNSANIGPEKFWSVATISGLSYSIATSADNAKGVTQPEWSEFSHSVVADDCHKELSDLRNQRFSTNADYLAGSDNYQRDAPNLDNQVGPRSDLVSAYTSIAVETLNNQSERLINGPANTKYHKQSRDYSPSELAL